MAGDVGDPERLIARSPEAHRRNGIDLRMRTEVEEIDLAAGRVTVCDLAAGRSYREGFDSLVIATGAVPVRPPLPGADAVGVVGVQTLDDGAALLADLQRAQPRRAVVVGGGYIGVEMAEALVRHGVAVTVGPTSRSPARPTCRWVIMAAAPGSHTWPRPCDPLRRPATSPAPRR